MQGGVVQLKKLRGRSLRELGDRGRQEFSKLSERLFGTRELSDAAFRQEISSRVRNGSAAGSAGRVLERLRSPEKVRFFPSLADRAAVVQLMAERFPDVRSAIIERAERARNGRFDLLGFADLDFGLPIDWRLEPVSGKRTPLDHWSEIDYLDPAVAGDKKITWELNRCAHFVAFGQAYWMTGDEGFAEAFVEQATAWMDANPAGRGINWASSLELAFRAIAWLWAVHLLAGSPRLDAAFTARLLKCLIAHGNHIETYLSTFFSPNTHLTGEALGLFYLGVSLPELNRAPGWRDKGLQILLEQLPLHVRRDGVYFEQSTYYHRYTVDFCLHTVILSQASGLSLPAEQTPELPPELPPELDDRLALALDYLMWTMQPDGRASLIGDDDGGRLIHLGARRLDDFRDTLATGAALMTPPMTMATSIADVTPRGDWKLAAGEAAAETLWLLGPEAIARFDMIPNVPPDQTTRAFPDSGYFVMRDGWADDATYAAIDCGPHGVQSGGHAHADALSFEFGSQGTAWLVDPGTYTYTGDAAARNWFRSTTAHNSVTVDGEQQSVAAGPFSWSHIADSEPQEFVAGQNFTYFEGLHNGYERLPDPVAHRRALLLVKAQESSAPSYLIIHDRFDAKATHRYAARYHFGAGCTAVQEGGVIDATSGNNRLRVQAIGTAPLAPRIEGGWVSRAYGERCAAPVAVFESEGTGRQDFLTLVIPGMVSEGRAGAATRAATQLGREVAAAPTGRAFAISSGTTQDLVIVGGGQTEVSYERLSAQAEIALARFEGPRFVSAFLSQGRSIEIKGEIQGEIKDSFALRSPTQIRFAELTAAEGALQITIHGASRFELSFSEPPGNKPPVSVVVNGARFTVSPECSSVAFALEGAGWALMNRLMNRN